MDFFIPHTQDAKEAESVLNSICKFIGAPVPEKRIREISYTHKGKKMLAEVSQPVDTYYKEGDQPVIAIIKNSACFCICLFSRGVVRGSPIYVGDEFDVHVSYFD